MADSDDSGHNNELSQERFLPIANVSRIMKKALPANAKISKDAKETVQECVSEFISFVTGEAADKCQREKRKTINGDDLLWAMTTLGFDDYVEPLKVYLQRFRDTEDEKSAMAGRKDESSGGDRSVVAVAVAMGNYKNGEGGNWNEIARYGAVPSNMMMMRHQHYAGHVYGSDALLSGGQNRT